MKDDKKEVQQAIPLGDVREWCMHQLESAVKKLTDKVSVVAYTRNPEALAAASRQCDELEGVLTACEFQLQQHAGSEPDYYQSMSQLLMVEAHQLLADARALVRVPLQPVHRGDNVVALVPSYSDLTDAAFERMLASSDIPQFLSTPASWAEEECQPAPSKPALKLVYSNDS